LQCQRGRIRCTAAGCQDSSAKEEELDIHTAASCQDSNARDEELEIRLACRRGRIKVEPLLGFILQEELEKQLPTARIAMPKKMN
jgi:hypothetical protein